MLNKIRTLLEMIKFKHSVFAMPFAFMGMLLAARGMVEGTVLFWVVIALIASRTCAMGFNRIVDRHFDALNPRTAARALPAGKVTIQEAWMLVLISGALFFGASYQLNSCWQQIDLSVVKTNKLSGFPFYTSMVAVREPLREWALQVSSSE